MVLLGSCIPSMKDFRTNNTHARPRPILFYTIIRCICCHLLFLTALSDSSLWKIKFARIKYKIVGLVKLLYCCKRQSGILRFKVVMRTEFGDNFAIYVDYMHVRLVYVVSSNGLGEKSFSSDIFFQDELLQFRLLHCSVRDSRCPIALCIHHKLLLWTENITANRVQYVPSLKRCVNFWNSFELIAIFSRFKSNEIHLMFLHFRFDTELRYY